MPDNIPVVAALWIGGFGWFLGCLTWWFLLRRATRQDARESGDLLGPSDAAASPEAHVDKANGYKPKNRKAPFDWETWGGEDDIPPLRKDVS